ncbi:helix-turn-helix domain-containing protein [Nostoc sp. MS1]|uniref:helix-turn-helix domain-containing protein n=1 Tax=Nostoc sp. MS1 TaxID=2764711 RepID=UPI001CC4BD1A|nr:helix-turn-helix domain-containing protein [Nostoc sp. MS1]BCL38351.1 hypothetical protein NSMS1_47980 [Nostoc sp. MS1]
MNKAKRAVIKIAGIEIDGFENNGKYFLSQSQVAEILGIHKYSTTRFIDELRKNQGYTGHILEVESNGKGKRGSSRVIAIPPNLASLFWGYQARKGNDKALALVCACAEEALERRLDRVFQQVKTEDEYENKTANALEEYCKNHTWEDIRGYCQDVHGAFMLASFTMY